MPNQINCVLHDGLGNRLFQIASLYSISKKLGREFAIVDLIPNAHSNKKYNHIYEHFKIVKHTDNSQEQLFREPEHFALTYSSDIIHNITHSITNNNNALNVIGFFQNEKYFIDYKKDILFFFREPIAITSYINNKYSHLQNAYFIHVRLGDYLTSKIHYVDLSKYYEKCIQTIGKNIILLFSNEPSRVYEVYPLLKDKQNIIIIDEQDELATLYIMARCSLGGICSNSTFSWWGSYLNKNPHKQVFMPDKWFTNNDTDCSDIFYEGVTIVDT